MTSNLAKVNQRVAIVVVTYNSAEFVIETLESAKKQSYANLELIITDDASKDNTLEICESWLSQNKSRFVRTKMVTVEENTGIAANINRALAHVSAEWFKPIAGDDILDEKCISNFMEFVKKNNNISVVSSSIQLFEDSFKKENYTKVIDIRQSDFFKEKTSAQQQYQMLLRTNHVHGPSIFFRKSALLYIGGFDENYKLFEDHPIHLRLTRSGFKINGLPEVTVYYRRHDNTVLRQSGERIFSDIYLKNRKFILDYIYPNVTLLERVVINMDYYHKRFFEFFGMNKEILIFQKFYSLSNKLIPKKFAARKGLKSKNIY